MEEISGAQNSGNTKRIAGMLALAVLVLGVGYYIFQNEKTGSTSAEDDASQTASTTETITVGGTTIVIPKGASVEIEEVPVDVGPAPSLERPIRFGSDFSAPEAQKLFLEKLDIVKERVAENSADAEAWIEAGLLFKMVSDYEGARLVWEYAKAVAPSNSVVYGNLGFLYGFHLGDAPRSIEHYKKALMLNPKGLHLYDQLFSVYRDVTKDYVAARALAAEGKTIAGNAQFFDQLLATLK